MSGTSTLRKSVLWGILLGLLVIAGLVLYPHVAERLKDVPSRVVRQARQARLSRLAKEEKTPAVRKKIPPAQEAAPSPKKAGGVPVPRKAAGETVPPAGKETLYPLKTFDSPDTAERFIKSIRKSTGLELRVKEADFRYVVLLPARDESEKERKADLIREKTGLRLK